MNWEVRTMRSGMSFFNKTIYLNCLRRFWPVWAGLTLCLVLMLPLPAMNMRYASDVETLFLGVGSYGGIVLAFGFSVTAAMTVYGWMYQTKSTGFTAALPLRREGMLLSTAAAGCTMLALPGVIAALLGLLAAGGVCGFSAAAALAGGWLGRWLLLALCFFGFATLCAQLTGAIWVLPAVYVLLNVGVAVIWYLIANVLELLLPGYAGEVPRLALTLSPVVRIFMFYWAESPFEDWAGLSGYAAFGVLCLVLSLLLARRRRMESATDTVAVSWLKPVFRWVFSIGFALCFANFLYLILMDGEAYRYVPMAFFLVLGGLLGWIIAEMLVRKSYKIGSALKTFPILAVLLIALVAFCAFGGLGYTGRVPDAESVKSAAISFYSYSCVTDDPAEIATIGELHRELADASVKEDGMDIFITYTLKNGGTLRRRYAYASLSEEGKAELRQFLERQEGEAISLWLSEPDRTIHAGVSEYKNGDYTRSFELGEERCRDILRYGVLPDMAAGTLRAVSGWPFDPGYAGDEEDCFYLEFETWVKEEAGYGYNRSEYDVQSFRVTPAAENTWAMLEKAAEEWEAVKDSYSPEY